MRSDEEIKADLAEARRLAAFLGDTDGGPLLAAMATEIESLRDARDAAVQRATDEYSRGYNAGMLREQENTKLVIEGAVAAKGDVRLVNLWVETFLATTPEIRRAMVCSLADDRRYAITVCAGCSQTGCPGHLADEAINRYGLALQAAIDQCDELIRQRDEGMWPTGSSGALDADPGSPSPTPTNPPAAPASATTTAAPGISLPVTPISSPSIGSSSSGSVPEAQWLYSRHLGWHVGPTSPSGDDRVVVNLHTIRGEMWIVLDATTLVHALAGALSVPDENWTQIGPNPAFERN